MLVPLSGSVYLKSVEVTKSNADKLLLWGGWLNKEPSVRSFRGDTL